MSEISNFIQERVKLKDYAERYMQLKAKGNGEYLGLCPLHGEKTPSFTINEPKLRRSVGWSCQNIGRTRGNAANTRSFCVMWKYIR